MIRRQVVARGRRTRQQWRSGSSGSSGSNGSSGSSGASPEAIEQRIAAATEPVKEGEEETTGVGTAEVVGAAAITARFADAEALCPAAEIIARAVEAVLYGSTSTFGVAAEGAAVAGEMGHVSDDIDMEGGEGSHAERDRYRDILEELGRAHGALRKALETAAGPSCVAPAVLSGRGEPAVAAAGGASKALVSSDTGRAGGNDHGCEVAEGFADGGGETSAPVSLEARVLPPASLWRFRCSSGGRAESEGTKRGEQEEEEREILHEVSEVPLPQKILE